MKDFYENRFSENINSDGQFESAPGENEEDLFSIPDETSCSPEFPQGCIDAD